MAQSSLTHSRKESKLLAKAPPRREFSAMRVIEAEKLIFLKRNGNVLVEKSTLGGVFVQFVFCWTAAAPTATSMDKWSTFATRIPKQGQSYQNSSAQFFYVLPTPGLEPTAKRQKF